VSGQSTRGLSDVYSGQQSEFGVDRLDVAYARSLGPCAGSWHFTFSSRRCSFSRRRRRTETITIAEH
jgi:hypothetical protein